LESWDARQLLLPTGQVLWAGADGATIDVELYTPAGTYQSAWQPTITSVASTLNVASTNNAISGKQFNGLSAGTAYGDDAQMATNYPLVRIKNNATGHVFYCKTHNHSTMGIATGTTVVSTQFDVPSTIETGASTLVVVANGIPSPAVSVTIAGSTVTCTPSTSCTSGGFNLDASITLTCNQASPIAVTAAACINDQACVNDSASGDTSSISTSANASGPYEEVGGSCNFTWTYNGQTFARIKPIR
jgi:hypothetical protein